MKDKREFLAILRAVDGLPASEYGRLVGDFDFGRFVIHVPQAPSVSQGEACGMFVVHVPQLIAGFPSKLFSTPMRRTALEDYLGRRLVEAVGRHISVRGPGEARIRVPSIGRQVLPRSLIVASQDYVEARLAICLPLRDGSVDSAGAVQLFFHTLPAVVNESLVYCYLDVQDLQRFVDLMEDVDHARRQLERRGLVAFIGDGTRLQPTGAPLELPSEGLVELDVPNRGVQHGLGIPLGVTVIVGDPYSGRQDLIAALANGVYNHVPDDGCEWVVSVPDTVRVDAEPGRSVQAVDIAAFRPAASGRSGRWLTADRATSLDSQMAGVVEAIHAGARVVLFDESSSDPAFLTGDVRAGGLRADAPVDFLSLAARARDLASGLRISMIVGVFAHVEEFLDVADTVLLLENHRLRDVTATARQLPRTARAERAVPSLPAIDGKMRQIIPTSIDPSFGAEDAFIQALELTRLRFGRYELDLRGVPQLVDIAQTAAIGLLMYHARLRHLDEVRTFPELLDQLDEDLASEGLAMLSRELRGDLARPRRYEIAAAMNRLRSLRIAAPNSD
jgi:predicted ABC-class ATPase